MTGEEYMHVLEQRRAEYEKKHSPRAHVRALLEWFIQPGDEDMVELPTTEHASTSVRRPRTYRPASHWREQLARVQTELDSIYDGGVDDPASVNLSPHARSRAARSAGHRRMAGLDREIQRAAHLLERRDLLEHKIRAAEARERKTT